MGKYISKKGIKFMKFEGFSTENKHISKCIKTTAETVIKDITTPLNERVSALGIGVNIDNIIPVYFAALAGSPSEDKLTEYKNSLCSLRNTLIESPKFLLFMQNELKAPSVDELSLFDAVSRGNNEETMQDFLSLINIMGDELRTNEARKIFAEMLEPYKSENPDYFFALGAKIITWLNRCTGSKEYAANCHGESPVIIYYGSITAHEVFFLHFMSRIGMDVLYIYTQKSTVSLLETGNLDGRMQIFEFPKETEFFPYPDKIIKTKLATVAYSAERDLDDFMYSNTSIFKDFQFLDMQALTLKTTYDEIGILWHQQAKYRSGFNVLGGKKAVIPNIFAKISGVKDGNINDYWDDVRSKLSPLTRIIYKAPTYDKFSSSVFTVYNQFFSGRQINIEQLKKSKYNSYSFLSDNLQNLIFEKIQEAVDSGLLLLEEKELVPLVLYVGLNIEKEILKILQKFDFTKDIPKIIVIDAIEDTFSKVECIQLILFNLLGFDILIYTPTGYKDLETYISPNAFETYSMNEYEYNVRVPRFKIPDTVPEPDNNDGFFSKLFKKGRK